MRKVVVHCTTVHPRYDVRIYLKEVKSVGRDFAPVSLFVADGLGPIERSAESNVEIVDIGKSRNRFFRGALGSLRMMMAVLRSNASLVHFHDPELIPMGLMLKVLRFQVVYDVHEDVAEQILVKHWLPTWVRRAVAFVYVCFEKAGVAAFDGFVAATPHIARKFPKDRTVVVQNFPIVDELTCPDSVGHKDRPLNFAYVGAMNFERGGPQMVDAIENVAERFADARLAWAGGFVSSELERSLARRAGWKNVSYRGLLDRPGVANLLSQSRAGIVVFQPGPNHTESQPNKLFEYMAAGLPVIASDFPRWREIISECRCGKLVDPADPGSIAQAMTEILQDPEEAEATGRRGRAAIENSYNWDCEFAKLKQLYEKLLSDRPR